ncbi:hypothetical protein CR205_13210 [Alteribacter lacisalsi]|uniref:Integral membrane protein n=1 Tax=Alteribacter lacisalsi TaxID=2045244 RepID=A0A2W0H487_9BACI|nr:hypothetical protein [Alteribacter lacisalsi]PYZ96653.1 hypothetical protein CR205_13210 [Alteribacter lacisalsi]
MGFLLEYQWEIFIFAEIISVLALLLFGFFRYFLMKKKVGLLFIFAFLALVLLEAVLGFIIYDHTGEFSTFQLVITIFVLYAFTFGIVDFLRLDRWMRQKIGKWRGVELLSEKDYERIKRNNDPRHKAKKYRRSSAIHLVIFLTAQVIFWSMGTGSLQEMIGYATDFSWVEAGTAEHSPYPNETLYSIGMIWCVVFIVDLIYSWSYTFFPAK